MPEFWRNSGYHLLDRDEDGFLSITDDFLRAFWMRPEVAPVEESCSAELALHEGLMDDPRRVVSAHNIAAMADSDIRENYEVVLNFREKLLAAATVEEAYMALFAPGKNIDIPSMFIDQLAHAIAHNIMADEGDPFRLRAAELLFRDQTVNDMRGQILLADAEITEMQAQRRDSGNISLIELAKSPETVRNSVEVDVLTADNLDDYWTRSEYFNMALDITFGRNGLDGFARVLERWIAHFLKVDVEIQPTGQITDDKWVRHVGLDSEATVLLNDLYRGLAVDEGRNERLLSLFRLRFRNNGDMEAAVSGRPVYLALCRTVQNRLKVKGQNLLYSLPLASSV